MNDMCRSILGRSCSFWRLFFCGWWSSESTLRIQGSMFSFTHLSKLRKYPVRRFLLLFLHILHDTAENQMPCLFKATLLINLRRSLAMPKTSEGCKQMASSLQAIRALQLCMWVSSGNRTPFFTDLLFEILVDKKGSIQYDSISSSDLLYIFGQNNTWTRNTTIKHLL